MNCGKYTKRMVVALSFALVSTVILAAPITYQLHVDGLSCPFCAYGIEKKLGAVKGVQGIETHIRDGTVIVTMKDGVTLDEASAEQAVKEAGFSLRKLEQVKTAPQGAPEARTK